MLKVNNKDNRTSLTSLLCLTVIANLEHITHLFLLFLLLILGMYLFTGNRDNTMKLKSASLVPVLAFECVPISDEQKQVSLAAEVSLSVYLSIYLYLYFR